MAFLMNLNMTILPPELRHDLHRPISSLRRPLLRRDIEYYSYHSDNYYPIVSWYVFHSFYYRSTESLTFRVIVTTRPSLNHLPSLIHRRTSPSKEPQGHWKT